jgi:hypothetical protein
LSVFTKDRKTCDFKKEDAAAAGPTSSNDDDTTVFEPEGTPSGAEDSDAMKEKLREINERWNRGFHISEGLVGHRDERKVSCDGGRKLVQFSSPDLWKSYFEAPELADELRAARSSDLPRRKADQERLARIIAPVLAQKHRDKVFQRLHCLQQD